MTNLTKIAHPEWLNKSLFGNIIRKDYNSCKIIGFSVNLASGKGENYASVLYRVKVKVENDTNGIAHRDFMVKVNHDSGFGVEMARAMNLFPKEIAMYQELLPAFEQYFAEVGENLKIGPKCGLAEMEPNQLIVLDDISTLGFRTADRLNGLDMKHVELIVEKLAKFHAASAVHVERVGGFDTIFDSGMVNEKLMRARDKTPYAQMLKGFLKDLKCSPILNTVLDQYGILVGDNVIDSTKRRKDRFNVLCHGDMWSNNVLFRYSDEGAVEECMLVDFQMCFHSTPMLDLHYLMVTSVNREDQLSQMDYVLHFYHKQLVKSLQKLKYKQKIPTLLELQIDFLDTGAYGVFTMLCCLPVVRAPPSDESNIENITSDSTGALELKRRIYTNPVFTDALEDLIPYFQRKGYFEV